MNALRDRETLARLIRRLQADVMAAHLAAALILVESGAGADVWATWRDGVLDDGLEAETPGGGK